MNSGKYYNRLNCLSTLKYVVSGTETLLQCVTEKCAFKLNQTLKLQLCSVVVSTQYLVGIHRLAWNQNTLYWLYLQSYKQHTVHSVCGCSLCIKTIYRNIIASIVEITFKLYEVGIRTSLNVVLFCIYTTWIALSC